jgi:flagellar biogenesis protein FliO
MTKPMVFKKENPASLGPTSNGDDVDSTLVIITVAVALVVVIAVILLFIYLNVRAKR